MDLRRKKRLIAPAWAVPRTEQNRTEPLVAFWNDRREGRWEGVGGEGWVEF